MPSSDTVSHVLPKNLIVAVTVPSHAPNYSNRLFETDPIVAFAAEAIGIKSNFSASLHACNGQLLVAIVSYN